jgi:hypothetical protein
VEYLAHRRRLSRGTMGARDRRRADLSRPRSQGRRQVRGPIASGTEGCVITRQRPIAERMATGTPHGRAVRVRGRQAPICRRHRQACLSSPQTERWVRIFPVRRLPVRFRAQTGARHRQVDDLRLFDVAMRDGGPRSFRDPGSSGSPRQSRRAFARPRDRGPEGSACYGPLS